MGKQTRKLATTVVAALLLVIVGILAGLSLVGNTTLGTILPSPFKELITVEPTEGTTSPITVGALRELHELATIEREDYLFVRRESGGTPFAQIFTGETVGLIAVGEVRAGIDLEELTDEDIQVNEATQTVTINLPEARVLDVSLDESQTEVFDRDTSFFTDVENSDLSEEARDVAIERLQAAAEEGDILDRANRNARTTLRTFILALGYEEVNFE